MIFRQKISTIKFEELKRWLTSKRRTGVKKALVVGSGGLNGAYSAGAVAELGRQLGPKYFDAVYASSVGVYAATFLVANQPDTYENTWRNLVDGKKLVNFGNVVHGRAILDLEYLAEIFQNEKSWLDTEAVFANQAPTYAVTEYPSGKTRYVRPDRLNIFHLMSASSAMPFVHWPVEINGKLYVDGGLADPLPVQRALADGFDRVVAVTNKQSGVYVGKFYGFSKIASSMLPRHIAQLVKTYESRVRAAEEVISTDRRVIAIRPRRPLPLRHFIDTDKRRINEAVQMGIDDARAALQAIKNSTAEA